MRSIYKVKVISKYKVNWGSIKHVEAILELLDMAVNDGCDYIHVISANTIPIKNPKEIVEFFKDNNNNYMDYYVIDEISMQDKHLAFMNFDYRSEVFFFQHIYNLKKGSLLAQKFKFKSETAFARLQFLLGIRRNNIYNYKGYIYCHVPNAAATYVLSYVKKHPEYLKKLIYCYVGEEFFFQNILMNSKFSDDVVNDLLIFDIWSSERGNLAFLACDDLKEMEKSFAMFARKVGTNNQVVLNLIRKKEKF